MRTHFWSDNGAACWKCEGTCYRYTFDDSVSLIATICVSCGGDNVFVPPWPLTGESTVTEVSLAHRETFGHQSKQPQTYTVYANVEQRESSEVSRHRTLKGAGKAYQRAHTGNLRRVLDKDGNDVTGAACDAANGY